MSSLLLPSTPQELSCTYKGSPVLYDFELVADNKSNEIDTIGFLVDFLMHYFAMFSNKLLSHRFDVLCNGWVCNLL